MLGSANFRTVLSESQKANPLVVKPKQILMQNFNAFKVIYFSVIEEPLRDYTA